MKNDINTIAIPNPKIVHFQIFFRKIPGSNILRINPIIGNTKRIYLTCSGRLNSVRVTFHPRRIVARSKIAKTIRVIRIVLSDGFWTSLDMRLIIRIKRLSYLILSNGGEREIRTPDILRYAPFPRVCTRPLCDLSRKKVQSRSRDETF